MGSRGGIPPKGVGVWDCGSVGVWGRGGVGPRSLVVRAGEPPPSKKVDIMEPSEILQEAKTLIRAEGEALIGVADQLDASFVDTVRLVSECSGRVLVSGAGTSGTIARVGPLIASLPDDPAS